MLGAFPDNLKEKYQQKGSLKMITFIYDLFVTWTVSHKGPGANQVSIKNVIIQPEISVSHELYNIHLNFPTRK